MSTEYYFLISQLPLLRLGETAGWTGAAFLAQCREHLAPPRFAGLARAQLAPGHPPCCATERRWQMWETFFRNCQVRIRAARTNSEAPRWLRPEADAVPSAARAVDEIWSNSRDPAARERALDEQRWHHLDDLSVGHEFDFDALFLYRLRLELAEKWAVMDAQAGRNRFGALVDAGIELAGQARPHP